MLILLHSTLNTTAHFPWIGWDRLHPTFLLDTPTAKESFRLHAVWSFSINSEWVNIFQMTSTPIPQKHSYGTFLHFCLETFAVEVDQDNLLTYSKSTIQMFAHSTA
jgi:hypothetical protein